MNTLRITPSRMDVDRLLENEQYLTNTYWLINKTTVSNTIDSLKKYNSKLKNKPSYNYTSPSVESCDKIINRANEGDMEVLAWNEIFTQPGIEDPEHVISDIPYTYMFNSKGEKTKLNGYFVTYFKKLGAVKFEQSQTFKNNPVIAKNNNDEFIGLIMPIRL